MTTTEEPDAAPARRGPSGLLARARFDVRARILAYSFVLLALALAASVLIAREVLLVRLDDRIDTYLTQEVREFRQLAGGDDPETGRPFGDDVERIFEVYLDRNVPGQSEQLITVPRDGRARFRASQDAAQPLAPDQIDRWRTIDEAERGEIETPIGTARYLAVPAVAGDRTLGSFAVVHFADPERQQINDTIQTIGLVAAAVLLAGTTLAYFAAGRVLAPLRELRDAARTVSGEDMSRRIELQGDDEIAELARTFNRMLDRLGTAFIGQRAFVRDVSHELRTPIAIVRGHLELIAAGQVPDEELDETIELLTGELDRMTRFVSDLLLLARAEQPDFLATETVELSALGHELVAKAQALGDRDWVLERAARRSIVADRQRLTQAVVALADNARAHTEPGSTIAIGLDVDGPDALVSVRDEGPGIRPDEVEELFEPFRRGSASAGRYEGSGLGLAIVKAIAEAHGGSVEVESELGRGTRIVLRLPVEGLDEPAATEEVTRG